MLASPGATSARQPAGLSRAPVHTTLPPMNDKILVLVAHPAMEQSRLNRRLMRSAAAASATPPLHDRIEVRDLYALYPDYLIDADAERQALATAQLIVWQHPMHWYGMPPLMKLWLDTVLGFGWAYGPGGDALRGKDLWLVLSTGGSESSYRPDGHNRYFLDAFMPPYEQTAVLCGLRFLPPLVQHAAHQADEAELERHAQQYVQQLERYPDWPELQDLDACVDCPTPADARPAELPAGRRAPLPFVLDPADHAVAGIT
jgi:glutathione-regulated potassium-efflux system ancillary protein KefF